MQQRKLGDTGLLVSEIGMGTWELGGREWGDIAETDAVNLLRYARNIIIPHIHPNVKSFFSPKGGHV